jgi:L-alanine-DL-glutamate epimerase-like enolase superfamily enzyme
MQLHAEVVRVRTTHPFIIARGGRQDFEVVEVRLVADDGAEGWGEASPAGYYGETSGTILAACERLAPVLADADGWSLERLDAACGRAIGRNPAAHAAVSAALHDLVGKRLGVPVWKLWGLDPADAPKSSFTIAIPSSMDDLRGRVREAVAAGYPILKVKLGSDRDAQIVRTVRETAPDALLRVDANCAWTARRALDMMPLLVEMGVEFVEQPLEPWDLAGLRFVRERAPLPIIADESCLVASDVPKLAGVVDGVNLKLAKCGSLREAIRLIHTARAHGMMVMAGCMIETSLGITAAAHLAPLLDYADLDGAALLADDPYRGATITNGVITLPTGAGLGVTRA